MNRLLAAVVALVGLCAVQTATAVPAAAHAELVSSSPADGSMLVALPEVVELVFSENVGTPADVVVLGPDGKAVASGELLVINDTATLPLESDSAALGSYTVSYQVTSADGHPISGFVTFMVHGDGSTAAAVPGDAATSSGGSDDADAMVVVALAAALAVAMAVAIVAIRRLVAKADELPAT